MKRVIVILILLAILGVVLLHICPPFESWLHQVTGWY